MYAAHRKCSHSLKGLSKKTPCSRHLIVKLYTLFKTKTLKTIACSAAHALIGQIRECPSRLENHTLLSGTYPHRPNKGVLSPG